MRSRRRCRMKYTKYCIVLLEAVLLALAPVLFAKNQGEARTEQDRLQNAGKVMQEILNVPDDIPQDLIDKARCVVVMPSVLKVAFVVGGSYGRGTMVCRTGKDFTGPWGAPCMPSKAPALVCRLAEKQPTSFFWS